ncbi:MAG: hypothetical protein JNJ76_05655 [Candidatus Competibacter sp.]|nr:hypothetical protein [Candidatus Competibacter sp.]
MQPQIDFSRTPEFVKFMAGLQDRDGVQNGLIQGVIIDLHPVWRRFWEMVQQTGINPEITGYPFLPIVLPSFPYADYSGYYDAHWNAPAWGNFCQWQEKENREPFLVKICVRPTTPSTVSSRRSLEEYARKQPFFATVEDRPIARMAAASNIAVEGGVDISIDKPGTLGGFLQDQHGHVHGITCGHVGQTKGNSVTLQDINGMKHANAGTVLHTNFKDLKPHDGNKFCNQYIDVPQFEVDAALIDLSGSFDGANTVRSIGKIVDIYDRTQLSSGQKVIMRGAVSGFNQYYIGGYGVTYKIFLDDIQGGNYYCFANLFEIVGRSHVPVPARIAAAIAPRAMGGDSGAWICCDNSHGNYVYCGNLIAVDGPNGYATFTDALRDWANREASLDLAVF